ncbi:hypothetical protein M6B38_176785 [Iris pallida]|uniref:Uncharacterized protein n=1 Tax=Iris pallida TaxID=29817 RepID=A0AAX6EQ38_IRIPA|nr:hypothetical protein M6B38_176785 [Iris pallida]
MAATPTRMAAITPATEPSEAEPPPQRRDLGESSAMRGFPGDSGGDQARTLRRYCFPNDSPGGWMVVS